MAGTRTTAILWQVALHSARLIDPELTEVQHQDARRALARAHRDLLGAQPDWLQVTRPATSDERKGKR